MEVVCFCEQVVRAVVGTYKHALAVWDHLDKPRLTIKAISKSYFIIPERTQQQKKTHTFILGVGATLILCRVESRKLQSLDKSILLCLDLDQFTEIYICQK